MLSTVSIYLSIDLFYSILCLYVYISIYIYEYIYIYEKREALQLQKESRLIGTEWRVLDTLQIDVANG